MLKKLLTGTLTAFICIALALTAALIGLGCTAEGTRQLFALISRYTPVTIEAGSVEGRLLGDLKLGNVRIGLHRMEIGIGRLRLDWLPHGLLNGRILVRELTLEKVRIDDRSPPSRKAPELNWPRISGFPSRLEARVESLRVTDLVYRHLEDPPVTLGEFSSAASWRDGVLSLEKLSIATPAGRVSGTVVAGFIRPSLKLDLIAMPSSPAAEIDRLAINMRLLPGRGLEQFSGPVALTGKSGQAERLALAAELAATRKKVMLRRLRLTRPGWKGMLTGSAGVTLTEAEPLLELRLEAEHLDLQPELKVPTDISGHLAFEGKPSGYRGDIDLVNRGEGLRSMRLSSPFSGDRNGIRFPSLDASLLRGRITGDVDAAWSEGLAVRASLRGRGLDFAVIDRRWQGVLNMDIVGEAGKNEGGETRGKVQAAILESTLHGRPLTGGLNAVFEGKNVSISRLDLRGKGFAVRASGELEDRLLFAADIKDLSGLVPDAAGEITAEGWVRRRGELTAGAVSARSRGLASGDVGIGIGEFSADIGEGKDMPLKIRAEMQKVSVRQLNADAAVFEMSGTMPRHTAKALAVKNGAFVRLAVRGGYRQGWWEGEITELAGRDGIGEWRSENPALVTVSPERFRLAPLVLNGTAGERLEASADLRPGPLAGSVKAQWNNLLMTRANPWLRGTRLDGATTGSLRLLFLDGERFRASGKIEMAGTSVSGTQRLTMRKGLMTVEWQERGLEAHLDLDLAEAGRITGRATSSSPPRFAPPSAGEAEIHLANLDLSVAKPWLPKGISVNGRLAGRMTGKLLSGRRLEILGKTMLADGRVQIFREGTQLTTDIRTLETSWSWRGEELRGGASLALAEGEARAEFSIPVPARLPAAIDRKAPVRGHATGEVRELGLVNSLFPGVVQETRGRLNFDLRADGALENPRITGSLLLAEAGAYVPSAGIRVSGLKIEAGFSGDRITVKEFRAVSGPGHIEGSGEIALREGQPAGYNAVIRGENFEALHLPEIRGLVTPKLNLAGDLQKLTVTGEVLIPELRITGETSTATVEPSEDVIIIDAPAPGPERRMAVTVRVVVKLGEHVVVKAKGIDAQLGGSLELGGEEIERLTSKGEIRVVKGRYKAYGINLEIVRGRVFYAGGPLDEPTLDILALRTVGDVKAGVSVGGTAQEPAIKLYSEPPMPDVDILAYVVLGHPLGRSGEQAGLVAQAAGALLSAGQSAALQDQLKSRLGLSTIEVGTAEKEAGHMGYKPKTITPAGVPATGEQTGNDLSQTTVTLGKYLTPKIYVSYGRSLFTGSNIFRLRYDLSRRWLLETQAGTESGADIYYKLEFN